jgi:hypothetical protein
MKRRQLARLGSAEFAKSVSLGHFFSERMDAIRRERKSRAEMAITLTNTFNPRSGFRSNYFVHESLTI